MSIAVCHGGDPIPKSPFHIHVAPLLDLSKVSIQGLNISEYIYANISSDSMTICIFHPIKSQQTPPGTVSCDSRPQEPVQQRTN